MIVEHDAPTNPHVEEMTLAAVMAALSDPMRVAIVRQLAAEGERTCGTFDLGISKATRSHHFRVLREAGLTHTRAEGTHRHVSLRREDVDARFPGLLDAVLDRRRARSGRYRGPCLIASLAIFDQQRAVGRLADDLGLDRVGHAALLPGDRRRRARRAAAQRLVAAVAALGQRDLAAPVGLAARLRR